MRESLFKLHLRPAARYSEDIDLVQIAPAPIGEIFDAIRAVLDPWLGHPRRQTKEGSVNLVYRFTSEDEPPKAMRLKIEINSREHFAELGHVRTPFEMRSRWWSGKANITTFALEELLGTKLRALNQRRIGRELFDLWYGLTHGGASPDAIVTCFSSYMRESTLEIPRALFEKNLARKLTDESFRADMSPLLRPAIAWDLDRGAFPFSQCADASVRDVWSSIGFGTLLPWRPRGVRGNVGGFPPAGSCRRRKLSRFHGLAATAVETRGLFHVDAPPADTRSTCGQPGPGRHERR